MADNYGPTFGTYATPEEVISAAAQTEVLALIDVVIALIPDGSETWETVHTDFDQIPPRTAAQLRLELAALKTAIDAAATA